MRLIRYQGVHSCILSNVLFIEIKMLAFFTMSFTDFIQRDRIWSIRFASRRRGCITAKPKDDLYSPYALRSRVYTSEREDVVLLPPFVSGYFFAEYFSSFYSCMSTRAREAAIKECTCIPLNIGRKSIN